MPSAVKEAKPIRQKAAVRSITPSQPAPMQLVFLFATQRMFRIYLSLPISNETSILSSSRQQEIGVSTVAEPIPLVKTVHTDGNTPGTEPDVSQLISEVEESPVVEKPIKEPIISPNMMLQRRARRCS